MVHAVHRGGEDLRQHGEQEADQHSAEQLGDAGEDPVTDERDPVDEEEAGGVHVHVQVGKHGAGRSRHAASDAEGQQLVGRRVDTEDDGSGVRIA